MLRGIVIACSLAVCACTASRFLGGTASALVRSPRKVEHKIQHPGRADARLAALWIGHATVLVQMDDRFILTDPVFVPTVGQLVKRLVDPGIDVAALPPLDVVLVSHVHFDHMSLGSIERIAPKVRMLVLPRGGTAYLTDFAFPSEELSAGRSWEKDGLRVTAVPVAHSGSRYGADGAWMHAYTGYVIDYHGMRVYFGGDSAYTPLFADAGKRYPNIDLAFLPISPLEPRASSKDAHMNPSDAVRAFLDLGAKTMIPIHYDTFPNPEDPPGGALRALASAAAHVPSDRAIVPLAIGEQRVVIAR